MSLGDVDERPTKKRRFFVEEEDEIASSNEQAVTRESPDASFSHRNLENGTWERERTLNTSGDGISVENADDVDTRPNGIHEPEPDQQPPAGRQNGTTFDTELFCSIVGQEIPQDTIMQIRTAAGDNMERAINMFFDGSWKNGSHTPSAVQQPSRVESTEVTSEEPPETAQTKDIKEWKAPEGAKVLTSMPYRRYIGAFGVGAWATRSGTNLLRHDEPVRIERTRSQPLTKLRRGGKVIVNQKADVLTRFTNKRGEEIGRLPQETAEWVSTLIDQRICDFEGVCVFAPDRIRVNDTIYLQLRCYLLKDAFEPDNFKSLDDNRSTGLFEQKESLEERDLRLRQVALVKLFDEINLLPTSTNETTVKHKKEGLLRAAEMAEQYDKNKKDNLKDTNELGDLSQEEESAELEEDQLDTLYKKAQSFDFSTPESQPAETFAMNLRKYQKQALHWMLAKEKDVKLDRETSMHPLWEEYKWPLKDVDDKVLPCVYRQDYFYVNPYSGELSLEFPVQEQNCLGGILADEMGLGKTIEMLSLIHSNRIMPDADRSVNRLPRPPRSSTGVVSAPYTTLVVAPTSLLSQWESEANKASIPGSLRTVIYYGADRSVNLKTLCSAANCASAPHLIITSYGVVLSEYRSLASRPLQSAGGHSGLFSLEFFRVILDEAHLIKNRRSKSARACYELKAIHRWVLTGTPIVNRLEDLFSLVRFLKVEPWSNFSFWKTFITVPFESKDYVRALNVVQTVLEPLVLRRTKTMKTPEGEALVPLPPRTIKIEEVELSQQEREIYDYIYTRAKRTFNDNFEAGTLLKSFSTIFAQILRLRQTCCHPILTRNKAIVAEEEDAAAAADAANDLKDDMDLQELIDRFTASTESADSNQQQDAAMRFSAHALRQIQNESSGECPICSEEPMIEPAVTGCWHSACKKCLEDFIRHQTDKGEVPRCFSCRAPVTRRDIFEVVRHRSPNSTPDEQDLYSSTPPSSSQAPPKISLRRIYPLSPSAHTSAKIHALISHLTRLPPNTKSVVFSQFTSFLDLIGPQLTKAGISHLRLDGAMPQKARAEVLRQFTSTETYEEELEDDDDLEASGRPKGKTQNKNSTSSPNVLLISLRAGGVGLNLTAASNVYMMDPWWSFAVEAQAIDRVHRMGQLREVSVTRFIVKDSIEGRMLRVQERKMNIAGTLGLRVGGDGSEEERRKERIEELKLLFE
ncbi:hypothetical protein VTN77DRAFT_3803 [Rasamsonia byssochlamydoides]|uniref:uncharacterized protein n=1 Tax=Rasamsonia byssochlamydoides TaxID=89139 RepID=UPI0037447C8B